MPRSLLVALVLSLAVATAAPAAQTIIVTTTADDGDGSFRKAIDAANASLDVDPVEIHFAIATGAQSIAPASALPTITRPVVIDATTQPGFAGAPLIELRGDSAPVGTSGLTLSGHDGSIIRGLVVNRFKINGGVGGYGIVVTGGSNGHVIAGNYLGTNATGTAAAANERGGVWNNGNGVTIGGTTAADRNVISGNFLYGVIMSAGTGAIIVGNYIGLNAAGTAAIGNNAGLFILDFSTNSKIGGDAPGERNVIGGNFGTNVAIGTLNSTGHVVRGNLIGTTASGTDVLVGNIGVGLNSGKQITIERNVIAGSTNAAVSVFNNSTTVTVRGNAIGTTADGATALPTSGIGVAVSVSASGSPVDVTIGGTTAGQGNLIRNCAAGGVGLKSGIANNPGTFSAPKRIAIRGNAIDANGGLGIDLERDGITPNDDLDVDDDGDGANLLQNFPTIGSATVSATDVTVTGALDSIPGATLAVDLFATPAPDASGHGEGAIYLGAVEVQTAAGGHGTFNKTFAAALPSGTWITATATDQSGNTSEFSAAVQAQDDAQNPPTTTTSSSSTTTTTIGGTTVPTTSTTSTSAALTTSTSATTATTSTSTSTTSSTTSSPTTATAPPTTSTVTSSTTTTTQPCNVTGIPRVRCLLDALPPAECTGVNVPPLATRVLASGRTLLDKAAATTGKPARRLLRRVAGRLGKAAAKVARAGKRGKLAQPCAIALSGGLSNARSETAAVVVP